LDFCACHLDWRTPYLQLHLFGGVSNSCCSCALWQ
jgi:hypothetical protein